MHPQLVENIVKILVTDLGNRNEELVRKARDDLANLRHELGRSGEAADACIFIVTPNTIAETLVKIGTALADPIQKQVPILIMETGPVYTFTGSIHSTYSLNNLRWHLSRAEPA